ncbi:MAG: glycosyltransferase family 4 protein [Actinomycetota bacterium]
MKVVYVCSLTAGGPLTHLRGLAPHVAAQGVDVRVVCADEHSAASFRTSGVDAVARPLGHKLDIRGAARVWPELVQADVVHTHDRRSGLLVRPLSRARGARSVHTLHGVPDELFGRVGRDVAVEDPTASRARLLWLEQGLLRIEALLSRFGTIVVPSRALADYVAAHGFPAQRLRVIPNGIAVRRREPAPAHDPVVVGTAALLERRKGIDILLEASARLKIPHRLVIYGDGPLRRELESIARRLGVPAEFAGFVPELDEKIEELDVFVLPSRGENLPIAILEAMAVAVPVVATRVGGVPEIVANGETGLLVEPDDVGGLAEALERVITDDALRERLGRAGATRIVEHFDAPSVARQMVALYRELLDGAES